MKDFLSEYGFAILAAIVVILLIAMCTPVGNLIKNQVLGVVDSFAGKTEAKLAALDDDAAVKVTIKEVKDSASGKGTGHFDVEAVSASNTDVFTVEYRIKDQNGNWSEWKKDFGATLKLGAKEHTGNFQPIIKNGESLQVRVYDAGKDANIYYESNIVVYTGAETSALVANPAAA